MGDGRMVRYRLLVAGMVQGVGFRYYVNYTARLLQLTGWVRNLEDGEVEIEVQGPAGEVDQFLAAVRQGNRYAQVDEVRVKRLEPVVEHGFEVVG